MRCKSIGITVALMVTVLLSFIVVQAIPVPPHQFYGTATLDGEAIEDDLIIEAKINSIVYGSSVTDNGKYGYTPLLKIKTDDSDTSEKEGGSNGEIVEFYIDTLKAAETFVFSDSTVTELALTFESICGDDECTGSETEATCCIDCGCPASYTCTANTCISVAPPVQESYCGDGTCNGNETYSSCSQDCETPSTTIISSNSGGGGSSSNAKADIFTPEIITFGEKVEMAEKSSSKINLKGETHTVQITTLTKSSATIMIYSNPVEVTLKIGESKEVDITEDDILDIKITLDNILNKKAYITIIELEQPEKKEQVNTIQQLKEKKSGDNTPGESITGYAIGGEIINITPVNILIVSSAIAIIVVMALFGIRINNKRKKKRRAEK